MPGRQISAGAARSVEAGGSTSRRGGSLRWLQGLVCGAVVTLATPSALLVAVLLLPTLLELLIDIRPCRPPPRALAMAGLAATAEPLAALWHAGHDMTASLALLGDVSIIATAWAAQGAAWLLGEGAPLAIRLVLDARSAARCARLRMERERHAAAWEVAGAE